MKGAPRSYSLSDFATFEGGAEELAAAARKVLRTLELGGAKTDASSVNMRLVRYYATSDVISRPERQGKEALYGYKQLVELVAARILLGDGWPLAKVGDYIRNVRLEELATLAAPQDQTVSAMRAISDIRERSRAPAIRKGPEAPPVPSSRQWYEVTGRQARLAQLRRINDAYNSPLINDYVSVSIAEDLHVLVGSDRLKTMTLEDAEAIGTAVTAGLVKLRSKGGKA